MTFLYYWYKKGGEKKNVDSVPLYGPFFQTQNNQYLLNTFFRRGMWRSGSLSEISFGLMKSGVSREMVITL